MKTKLLFLFTVVIGMSMTSAQSFSNITTDSPIPTNTTDFSITFDFDGVSAGDTMEWQIKTSDGAGGVDWGSPTLAYGTAVAFNATPSGNQTLTLSLGSGGGSPTIVEGQELIWFGKINDSGNAELFATTSGVFSVSDNLSVEDINANQTVIYPNPAKEELFINASQLQAKSIQVFDMTGRVVLNIDNALNTESINVSELKQGLYILVTDTKKQFRFLKQ